MRRTSRLALAASLIPLAVLAFSIQQDISEALLWVPAAIIVVVLGVAVVYDRIQSERRL